MWSPACYRGPLLRPTFFICLLAFAGCAAERGAILESDPRDYSDASFLEVPEGEYFWLQSPSPGNHAPPPAEQQVARQGLWLKAGWIEVESQCFRPKKAEQTEYPIFPEYADQSPVYIEPGRHYLLSCDDYKVGKFSLFETGRL